MNAEIQSTPASKWREGGEPDPHGERYDCERSKLVMGNLTDDELANEAFLNYDSRPAIADLMSGKAFMPIVYMTAVKDRIRWLSRALTKAASQPTPAAAHEPITASEALSLHAVYDWINQQDKPLVARELEPILAKLASLGYLHNVVGGEYIKARA